MIGATHHDNWRSNIHTLLIGDPSTAKSAILH